MFPSDIAQFTDTKGGGKKMGGCYTWTCNFAGQGGKGLSILASMAGWFVDPEKESLDHELIGAK